MRPCQWKMFSRNYGIMALSNWVRGKIAYLEHDGYFSVYEFKPDSVQPGLLIVPPHDISEPTADARSGSHRSRRLPVWFVEKLRYEAKTTLFLTIHAVTRVNGHRRDWTIREMPSAIWDYSPFLKYSKNPKIYIR